MRKKRTIGMALMLALCRVALADSLDTWTMLGPTPPTLARGPGVIAYGNGRYIALKDGDAPATAPCKMSSSATNPSSTTPMRSSESHVIAGRARVMVLATLRPGPGGNQPQRRMARKSEAAFSIWQTSPAAALPGDPFQFGSPGLNNWQEWRCQTDPTDAQSALRLLSPTVTKTNVLLTWQSVAGANYFLQRSTNLAAPTTFATIVTNIPGQAGTTTYTDTNAVGAGAAFYRTGVGN